MTLVVGVLAIATPAYFPAPAIPIWGIVIGIWLLAARRVPLPAVANQRTT